MPEIRSSAELRNRYNEISTFCHDYAEPVFVTKNGKGDLAVMSIEAYEALAGRLELYSLLQEGLDDVAEGDTRPFSDKTPSAADSLIDEAEKAISSLSHMPERFALVDDKLLAAWGIRFIRIKNYLAFYTVSQDEHTVYVLRFLYGKSDWTAILHSSILSE